MTSADLRTYITSNNLTIKAVSEITHIPYRTLQGWISPSTVKAHREPPEWAVFLAVEKLKGGQKMKNLTYNGYRPYGAGDTFIIESYADSVKEAIENGAIWKESPTNTALNTNGTAVLTFPNGVSATFVPVD